MADNTCTNDQLRVAMAQMAPVWLDRTATIEKMLPFVSQAAGQSAQLIVFGEALLPGYPFWLDWTDGARFNSDIQKQIHAHYLDQAIQIEVGHLEPLCRAAAEHLTDHRRIIGRKCLSLT